ncbi:MAG: hypothetical protein ABIN01_19235 [Ferruginibacter sp.]
MKKLFTILLLSSLITACDDAAKHEAAADIDSVKAATTTDSLAAIKVTTDTLKIPGNGGSTKSMDSSMKAISDSLVKK